MSLNAYQETAPLKTIELDVFTAIGEGSNDGTTLARKVGAAERGIHILCDFLTIRVKPAPLPGCPSTLHHERTGVCPSGRGRAGREHRSRRSRRDGDGRAVRRLGA